MQFFCMLTLIRCKRNIGHIILISKLIKGHFRSQKRRYGQLCQNRKMHLRPLFLLHICLYDIPEHRRLCQFDLGEWYWTKKVKRDKKRSSVGSSTRDLFFWPIYLFESTEYLNLYHLQLRDYQRSPEVKKKVNKIVKF